MSRLQELVHVADFAAECAVTSGLIAALLFLGAITTYACVTGVLLPSIWMIVAVHMIVDCVFVVVLVVVLPPAVLRWILGP